MMEIQFIYVLLIGDPVYICIADGDPVYICIADGDPVYI